MSLLHLPTELILLLVEFPKADKDINSLSRTNGRLYNFLNRYLSRHNSEKSGNSALLWAANHGNETTADMCINKGSTNTVTDNTGQTPLSWAARNGHETVVKLLLNTEKVDVDSRDLFDQTPSYWAARNGHEAIVKLLLSTEVDS